MRASRLQSRSNPVETIEHIKQEERDVSLERIACLARMVRNKIDKIILTSISEGLSTTVRADRFGDRATSDGGPPTAALWMR